MYPVRNKIKPLFNSLHEFPLCCLGECKARSPLCAKFIMKHTPCRTKNRASSKDRETPDRFYFARAEGEKAERERSGTVDRFFRTAIEVRRRGTESKISQTVSRENRVRAQRLPGSEIIDGDISSVSASNRGKVFCR